MNLRWWRPRPELLMLTRLSPTHPLKRPHRPTPISLPLAELHRRNVTQRPPASAVNPFSSFVPGPMDLGLQSLNLPLSYHSSVDEPERSRRIWARRELIEQYRLEERFCNVYIHSNSWGVIIKTEIEENTLWKRRELNEKGGALFENRKKCG